jgi:NAD(P)-dependent dehydrogenase (short-subunit alcohol dehydrogenase family)
MQSGVRAFSFNEGVAFVAGGSGGIGAAITQALAAAGSDVLFTYYRNFDAATRVREAAGRDGRRVECVQLALEDSASVAHTLEDARSRFGKIHSVIYAAGPSVPINFLGQIREEDWIKTFAMDTHACFNLVHAALPILKSQGGGSLTAVTTTQFARHVPMSVLSSAPKAAIESMMQVVAKEYGRYGVRANCVRSGWLAGGKLADGIGGQVQEKAMQAIVAQIPMGALGDPADVAAAVTFLSSQAARYITGDALTVDGGWRL